VIFDVIVFPLVAALVVFRDLSHKNARLNHTIRTIDLPCRKLDCSCGSNGSKGGSTRA